MELVEVVKTELFLHRIDFLAKINVVHINGLIKMGSVTHVRLELWLLKMVDIVFGQLKCNILHLTLMVADELCQVELLCEL